LAEEVPDLVLVHLGISGMSGLDLLRHLELDDLPVIALASSSGGAEPQLSVRRASLMLSKSDLTSGVLRDAIDKVLGVSATVGTT
jgi:CheY-like chemotaxis protein